MKLRPLSNNLIIKPDPEEFIHENPQVNEALKAGTLILPEKVEGFLKKTPMRGEVISAGPQTIFQYKKGARIIYGRFAGAPISDGLRIINELDVLAIEDKDA